MLVEGTSDQVALDALAERRGRDLGADGVRVVALGGSKNIRRALERFGPHGLDIVLAGLYDEAEVADFRRALQAAGVGSRHDRDGMETLGFYACVADLEEELIRSVGTAAVEQIIDAQGELGAFRTLQKQAAQRERSIEDQMHRFLGSRGGRKIRYARLLVDALDLGRVPRPLDRVLTHV